MNDLSIHEESDGFLVEPNHADATEWLCCHVPADTLTARGAFLSPRQLDRLQWDAAIDQISY